MIDSNTSQYQGAPSMSSLADLCKRYQNRFQAPQATVEMVAKQKLKELSGFDYKIEYINYVVNTRTLYIKGPSLMRSEIAFYKGQLLSALAEELGKSNAPKIII